MELNEIVTESFVTLFLNKMRTSLAVLGIVIGIGSVIALISLGSGSQKAVTNQIQSLGANLVTVGPRNQSTNLTLDDANAIKNSNNPDILYVSPEYSKRIQVVTAGENTNTQVVGATSIYMDVHKIEVETGNFITDTDNISLARVAVVGPTVATNLSVNVGDSIRIQGQALRIIGITKSKGGSGFNNQDDLIYVPLNTAMKSLFGATSLGSIAISAKSEDIMTKVQDDVGYLLLARHKLTDPAKADFSIYSQEDILNTASSVTGTFTALLSGIAAISLVVGGIGIMNIMLVTVTERTREIGLRKALGAKKKDIILQFLIESIILTFFGGVIGMVVGILISLVVSKILSLPFTISIGSIVLAIGVSGAIGILFGWYPAKKASDLQPIEALRYE
jgi:putative ABC transport system permease protein